MSNILLIYPEPSPESPQRNPALSIFYPGAACEKADHRVKYYVEGSEVDLNKNLALLIRNADIIGFSSMMGYQWERTKKIIKGIRKNHPKKPIVLGGVMANILPQIALKYVSCCIKGDGETGLISYLSHRKPPLVLRAKPIDFSKDYISPITDETFEYFYNAAQRNSVILPSSRGCPYKCGFCVVGGLYKNTWREIPFNQWAMDIDKIHGFHPFKYLELNDENFLPTILRIRQYGAFLQGLNIDWHLHLRADAINRGMVHELSKYGCSQVHIGVETGSERLLELVNKKITLPQIINAAELLTRYKIKATYTLIMGLPTETREELFKTMSLMDSLYRIHKGHCRMTFYKYQPLHGSPLYDNFRLKTELTGEHNNIYYIAGLTFNSGKGDKSDQNFPGSWRILIKPLEYLGQYRWRKRFFKFFLIERLIMQGLLRGRRYLRKLSAKQSYIH